MFSNRATQLITAGFFLSTLSLSVITDGRGQLWIISNLIYKDFLELAEPQWRSRRCGVIYWFTCHVCMCGFILSHVYAITFLAYIALQK